MPALRAGRRGGRPARAVYGRAPVHYMAAGALGFVVVEGANVLANPIMLYGLLFAISSMALVGLDREMRMSGGERDD